MLPKQSVFGLCLPRGIRESRHLAHGFQAGHGGLLACSGGSDALAAMLPSFSQVIEKDLPSYL